MCWSSWIFGYLLVGFVLDWVAIMLQVSSRQKPKDALLATLLWPIGLVQGFVEAIRYGNRLPSDKARRGSEMANGWAHKIAPYILVGLALSLAYWSLWIMVPK